MEKTNIGTLVSNCPLCDERSLHAEDNESSYSKIQQCINCGFMTSADLMSPKETNESFKVLSDGMKSWSVEKNGQIWLPQIITLPVGMVHPINKDNLVNHRMEMKWAFAPMVEIPEDERKNYPTEDDPNKFYDKKIDTEDLIIFDEFILAFHHVTELFKDKTNGGG